MSDKKDTESFGIEMKYCVGGKLEGNKFHGLDKAVVIEKSAEIEIKNNEMTGPASPKPEIPKPEAPKADVPKPEAPKSKSWRSRAANWFGRNLTKVIVTAIGLVLAGFLLKFFGLNH